MFPTTLPQVSYISDSTGKRTAAIIPIQAWEEIEREIASEQETAYLSQSLAKIGRAHVWTPVTL